jgi:hypothetical protein
MAFATTKNYSNSDCLAVISEDKVKFAVVNNHCKLTTADFQSIHFGVNKAVSKPFAVYDLLSNSDEKLLVRFNNSDGCSSFGVVQVIDTPDYAKMCLLENKIPNNAVIAIGKSYNQYIDGIYVFDKSNNHFNLSYVALRNVFQPEYPALPIRFSVANNIEAMCTLETSYGGEYGTHLFTIGSDEIGFLAFEEQRDFLKCPELGNLKTILKSDKCSNINA